MSPPNTERPPDRLVDHLRSLAAQREESAYARATLARLRAALTPERALESLHIVLPHLDERAGKRAQREDDAILLAGLFALHPEHGAQTLAAALRKVATSASTGFDENGSGVLRFRALLSASRDDLAPHLRAAVSLVAAAGEPIHWYDLHEAIQRWGSNEKQRREWARDFWSAPQTAETSATTASSDDARKE